jgi:hypothetical protein
MNQESTYSWSWYAPRRRRGGAPRREFEMGEAGARNTWSQGVADGACCHWLIAGRVGTGGGVGGRCACTLCLKYVCACAVGWVAGRRNGLGR